MQNRKKAVILSLGMLLRVEIEPFMAKMIGIAKQENPEFDFATVKDQAFALSSQFNRGQIVKDEFAKQMLQLLGITSMKLPTFWSEWNSMVDVTGLKDGIAKLQAKSQQDDILFYLISDTNKAHAMKIREKAKEQKVRVNINAGRVSTIDGMPFYPSFECKKTRYGLVEKVVENIKLQSSQPESITVLYGDPMNFTEGSALRNKAELELKRMKETCQGLGVNVALHGNDLGQTLDRLFVTEVAQIQRPTL